MDDTFVARAEVVRETVAASAFGIVSKPLSAWERITNVGAVRKVAILLALAMVWEAYARWLHNPLLLPTFSATIAAFWDSILAGALPRRALTSLQVLA